MTFTIAVTQRGNNLLRAVAPPPIRSSEGGGGTPGEGDGDGKGGGNRGHHRLLILLAVYIRARLRDRRGNRIPHKVSLRRVREVSGLPAMYVEELVVELVEEGYLEYRPGPRMRILETPRLAFWGSSTRDFAPDTTFVSLTGRGLDYPDLERACELFLGSQKHLEEVTHHLTMPRRFVEDLRSEEAGLRDYAWSIMALLGTCMLVSLAGSVALVLEVVI